ncbi:MAG: glycoside hydrolase family 3 C-terminal domain-containing protein [Maribacter sp.]
MDFPFQDHALDSDSRAEDVVSRMTLDEKISQMQDVAPPIARLGIPEYNWWNECLHGVARAGAATSFPQAIGMAATWNPELINTVADVISSEARAKFNHSVKNGHRNRYQGLTMWSPNINIFRDPRWGRGQETYGEDPYLTSRLGVAFIKGLQGDDPDYFKVIATAKHYAVHSGPEYNRHTFDAYADKKDLWETYLPAFKAAVLEAKTYSVMSAYNRYLGESATASSLLLQDILRDTWGFKGYVVSDCGAVEDIYLRHKIVETAEEAAALAVKSGCDLNCGSTYAHLKKAVTDGYITEKEIDTAVKRLFLARIKLGLLNTAENMPFANIQDEVLESEANQKLALQTARESMVLLKNEKNTLPISKEIKTIAVIGPTANDKQFLLGNYFGTPTYRKTILEGIQDKVSKKTIVHYFKGTNITDEEPIFDIIDEKNFNGKIKTEYFNNSNLDGNPVAVQSVNLIDFDWGGAVPIVDLIPGEFSIRYTGTLVPDFSGNASFSINESGGSYSFSLDGKEMVSGSSETETLPKTVQFPVVKNKKLQFVIAYKCTNPWISSIQFLWNKEHLLGKDKMIEKVSQSDLIIYVGGITARLEGEEMPIAIEGFSKGDRTDLKLPSAQQNLIKELYALGKPIVFVLTGGSAMAINWENENLPAILNAWYPGQAGGSAVADILFGDYNPSGKLPVTFYKSVTDLPPFEDYHMKGRTYRYFDGDVLYPFGYGLSYTHFSYATPVLEKSIMNKAEKNNLEVIVTNDGDYDGQTVVQLYVKDQEASVTKPLKSLRKFQKIFLKKGESKTIEFEITPEDLSIFDTQGNSFVEPGAFDIFMGENSATQNKTSVIVQ